MWLRSAWKSALVFFWLKLHMNYEASIDWIAACRVHDVAVVPAKAHAYLYLVTLDGCLCEWTGWHSVEVDVVGR